MIQSQIWETKDGRIYDIKCPNCLSTNIGFIEAGNDEDGTYFEKYECEECGTEFIITEKDFG